MEEIYVIMFTDTIYEDKFITDENEVARIVETLNRATNNQNYWYKRLVKF
jgi:hypothetical protein